MNEILHKKVSPRQKRGVVGTIDYLIHTEFYFPTGVVDSLISSGKDLSMYYVDFGITHEVFNGNGTLALNVRDLFNTRKRNSIVNSEGLYSKSENRFRTRQIMLTFTFRLNREANGKGGERDESNGDNSEL
jgi:hypothetical protein